MVNQALLNQKTALDVAAIRKTEREYHEAKAQARKKQLQEAGVVSVSGGGGSGVGGGAYQTGSARSTLLADVEKIRLGILELLEGDIDSLDKMPGAMDKLTSLDQEVKEIRQEVQKLAKDLTSALGRLEQRLSGLALAPQSGSAAASSGDSKQQTTVQQPKAAPAKKDDDDIDLFGSDDEENDPEAEKLRQERLAAYENKKSKKPALVAKSNIILDVKPWDDETDLKAMEEKVRSVETDGLLWGASKLVPIAFGIKKLQISCVVEDDKVSVDWLEEQLTGFEDYVQSVDIVAFNKI